ncbi:MAG TPA: GNAT family N-acetyltransferase [Ktedonobacterales bacterium]
MSDQAASHGGAHEQAYALVTPRLRLRALSLDEVRLAMRGDRAALGARLGAAVPLDWPGANLATGLPEIAAEMAARGGDERWVWVVIEPATGAVAGDVGFHSPVRGVPSVELGYVILPPYRGRGYATEATGALASWALTQPGVERVILLIAPENAASLRVAAKLGMREVPSAEPAYRCFERRREA